MNGNVHSPSTNVFDTIQKTGSGSRGCVLEDIGEQNENHLSQSANVVDLLEIPSRGTRSCAVEDIGEKNENDDFSQGEKSLGERVRKEVRERLGEVGDEMFEEVFDEDDSVEVPILEEEEIIRGTRDVGALWKLALCATVSFATYIMLSGPRFQPNWIPNFTERDPIPKIYLQKKRK